MDLYALPPTAEEDSEHTGCVDGLGKQLAEPWATGTNKKKVSANSDGNDSDEEAATTTRDAPPLPPPPEELRAHPGYDQEEMGYVLTERGRGRDDSSEGVGVIRMGGRLRSEEGLEMVELEYADDDDYEEEVGEEGRHDDSDGDAGGFDDADDAGRTELKSGGGFSAAAAEACRRAWWAARQAEWGDILLHDALPPFVSYWAIWTYAVGYTWGLTAQWLAFIPLLLASLTCVYKTALVGKTTDWAVEGNDFVERLFGLTFPSVLFPLGLLLVHLKQLDVLADASWPAVLIPFWTIYLLFLSFPAVSLFFHATLRRTVGGAVGRFECSWFYLIKWPLLIPTIVFNIMLSAREDLPWVVTFLPLGLALFSSLMSCFYLHLPNTKEVDRFMNSMDETGHIELPLDEKDVV